MTDRRRMIRVHEYGDVDSFKKENGTLSSTALDLKLEQLLRGQLSLL